MEPADSLWRRVTARRVRRIGRNRQAHSDVRRFYWRGAFQCATRAALRQNKVGRHRQDGSWPDPAPSLCGRECASWHTPLRLWRRATSGEFWQDRSELYSVRWAVGLRHRKHGVVTARADRHRTRPPLFLCRSRDWQFALSLWRVDRRARLKLSAHIKNEFELAAMGACTGLTRLSVRRTSSGTHTHRNGRKALPLRRARGGSEWQSCHPLRHRNIRHQLPGGWRLVGAADIRRGAERALAALFRDDWRASRALRRL
mmetsp:Transcript_9671/g.24357  ORF Transcript_9671/g.24357 Transcript_9671/m.24357 type:complete len:257 (-) Transcript_9671:1232-2002(-)